LLLYTAEAPDVILLRMTSRRWMVLVAVIGLLLGVVAEGIQELGHASQYQLLAESYRLGAGMNRRERVTFPGAAVVHGALDPELAAYYAKMKRKYEREATRPWLPSSPIRLRPSRKR
jgi:hypothetical protein